MYSMTIDEAMYTASTVLAEKENSLWKRFKKYLAENSETICNGLASMSGNYYVPINKR